MTAKEIALKHLEKSADHHLAMAKTEKKISTVHGAIGESHTNAVLGQHHRDLSDHHGARAQHHAAHAKHLLEVHQSLGGITPELFDEHSDAGDTLRSSVGLHELLKRAGIVGH